MSVKKITQAWDIRCDSHTEKLVLIALADNASDEGYCWPSVATLAEKCDMSDRGIQKTIRKLEDNGLLKVEQSKGGRKRNQFWVLTGPVNGVHPTGERGSPLAVNGVHPTGERGSPHIVTVTEPSTKPSKGNRPAGAVHSFIAAWCNAYFEVTGRKYIVVGKADSGQAVRLLDGGSDPAELIALARRAWKSEGFYAKQCHSLASFVKHVNNLRNELALPNGVTRGQRPPRDAQMENLLHPRGKPDQAEHDARIERIMEGKRKRYMAEYENSQKNGQSNQTNGSAAQG